MRDFDSESVDWRRAVFRGGAAHVLVACGQCVAVRMADACWQKEASHALEHEIMRVKIVLGHEFRE
jgi:hypothetical protein